MPRLEERIFENVENLEPKIVLTPKTEDLLELQVLIYIKEIESVKTNRIGQEKIRKLELELEDLKEIEIKDASSEMKTKDEISYGTKIKKTDLEKRVIGNFQTLESNPDLTSQTEEHLELQVLIYTKEIKYHKAKREYKDKIDLLNFRAYLLRKKEIEIEKNSSKKEMSKVIPLDNPFFKFKDEYYYRDNYPEKFSDYKPNWVHHGGRGYLGGKMRSNDVHLPRDIPFKNETIKTPLEDTFSNYEPKIPDLKSIFDKNDKDSSSKEEEDSINIGDLGVKPPGPVCDPVEFPYKVQPDFEHKKYYKF